MSKKLIIAGVAALIAVILIAVVMRRSASTAQAAGSAVVPVPHGEFVAGPGRVEPNSEDIKVGSELSGKLKQVLVEEGDNVTEREIVAVLVNEDMHAQVLSSQAIVRQREAELRKVINGARAQERKEAYSTVEENKAVMENARAEMERHNKLFVEGIISREENERYIRQYNVAAAQYQQSAQHHSLIDDKAREEDRSAAEAALDLARAQLAEAEARYEKTLIRSPINGVILRKHHRSGESVSNSSTVPDPIVTIGDNSMLRVRVDVDETEVALVKVGQPAYVTADAFGKQRFPGHVIRVGKELGRKNVQTSEPTEKVDTKILETLIQLDPGVEIPIGLRVDAYIQTSGNSVTN
jgi:HlyD family secretion protein